MSNWDFSIGFGIIFDDEVEELQDDKEFDVNVFEICRECNSIYNKSCAKHMAIGICSQCWEQYVFMLDWCKFVLMQLKKMCELNVAVVKNVEIDGMSWYQDFVNKGILFTIGVPNRWNKRREEFVVYCDGRQEIVLCTGWLEFYEINKEARAILHFSASEDVAVYSVLLDCICVCVNDYAIHLAKVKEKLQELDKTDFDGIQISIVDRRQKALCSNCWYCTKKLEEKKKKKCKGCKIAVYCCRRCQKRDWKLHKKFCKQKRLVIDDQKNKRYMHDWY